MPNFPDDPTVQRLLRIYQDDYDFLKEIVPKGKITHVILQMIRKQTAVLRKRVDEAAQTKGELL